MSSKKCSLASRKSNRVQTDCMYGGEELRKQFEFCAVPSQRLGGGVRLLNTSELCSLQSSLLNTYQYIILSVQSSNIYSVNTRKAVWMCKRNRGRSDSP